MPSWRREQNCAQSIRADVIRIPKHAKRRVRRVPFCANRTFACSRRAVGETRLRMEWRSDENERDGRADCRGGQGWRSRHAAGTLAMLAPLVKVARFEHSGCAARI